MVRSCKLSEVSSAVQTVSTAANSIAASNSSWPLSCAKCEIRPKPTTTSTARADPDPRRTTRAGRQRRFDGLAEDGNQGADHELAPLVDLTTMWSGTPGLKSSKNLYLPGFCGPSRTSTVVPAGDDLSPARS